MNSQASGPTGFSLAAATSSNGKGDVAGETNTVELDQMKPAEDEVKLPLHEDIMQLAMLGELGPIQKLFHEGRYPITHRDGEGITPLHVRSTLHILEAVTNKVLPPVGRHK